MPTGFDQAKKVGDYSSRGSSFQERPKGVTYFSLKNDQDEAIVRFLQQHDDINWVRQWRTEPKPGHMYGEKLNCIDQFEDGTPDPGFELGMKSSWSGFIPLIWRNAVQYQKDAQGRRVKDGNGNFVIAGYADTVALWEHPWSIYDLLKSVDDDYRGLMSRDFKIKRIGAKGSNKTTYRIVPHPIDGQPTPFSPEDQQLAAAQAIDIAPFVRIPTYEELSTYLNGGQPVPQMGQQAMAQSVPVQHQAVPTAPALGQWPAQQQPAPMAPPAPPTQIPAAPVQPAAGETGDVNPFLSS